MSFTLDLYWSTRIKLTSIDYGEYTTSGNHPTDSHDPELKHYDCETDWYRASCVHRNILVFRFYVANTGSTDYGIVQ